MDMHGLLPVVTNFISGHPRGRRGGRSIIHIEMCIIKTKVRHKGADADIREYHRRIFLCEFAREGAPGGSRLVRERVPRRGQGREFIFQLTRNGECYTLYDTEGAPISVFSLGGGESEHVRESR
jgi:hypothetical protein